MRERARSRASFNKNGPVLAAFRAPSGSKMASERHGWAPRELQIAQARWGRLVKDRSALPDRILGGPPRTVSGPSQRPSGATEVSEHGLGRFLRLRSAARGKGAGAVEGGERQEKDGNEEERRHAHQRCVGKCETAVGGTPPAALSETERQAETPTATARRRARRSRTWPGRALGPTIQGPIAKGWGLARRRLSIPAPTP